VPQPTLIPEGHKRCRQCRQIKPEDQFGKNGRKLRSACRSCTNSASKNHYRADSRYRDGIRARKADYYQRNRDRIIAKALEYEKRNPVDPVYRRDKSKAWANANPDRYRGNIDRWRQENPERDLEIRRRASSRWRAKVRGLPSEPYTEAQILARDGTDCVLCGEILDLNAVWPHPRSPTVEHLECLSWSNSAGTVLSNLSMSHWDCNNRRRDKPHPAAARKRAELLAAEQELTA
jgi:hypothetical protein